MRDEGLRVRLSRISGVTKPGVLTSSFTFQCPPLEEFAIDEAYIHSDYDTISSGSFSRAGGRSLRTFSFDTLVVDEEDPAYAVDIGVIAEDVDTLRDILRSGTAVRFVATHRWGLSPEVDMPVTLRSLRPTERMGEPDARYLSLAFSEWRNPRLKRDGKAKRRGTKPWPMVITLKKDTRWSVAVTTGPAVFGSPTLTATGPGDAELTLRWIATHIYHEPHLAGLIASRLTPRIGSDVLAWAYDAPLALYPPFKGKQVKISCPYIEEFDRVAPDPSSGRTPGNFRI